MRRPRGRTPERKQAPSPAVRRVSGTRGRGAPVRIWREVVDKRTGEVWELGAVTLTRVSLMMNELYQRPVDLGWARRLLRELDREWER